MVELWPDNAASINFYLLIHTQWRAGPHGVIGLDYGVVFAQLARLDLSEEDRQRIFDDVRVIESEARQIL